MAAPTRRPVLDTRRFGRTPVAFLFVLADPAAIVLQESELDAYRFVPPSAVPEHLPRQMAVRVASALAARDSGTATGGAAYVPADRATPAGPDSTADGQ